MKCEKLDAYDVVYRPTENIKPAHAATLRYPKFRKRGPLNNPTDIPKAEFKLIINEN